jgi:hypothetical protein
MEGPAFDGFAELEAEVRRLFRSARLWHQVEPWAVKSLRADLNIDVLKNSYRLYLRAR